MSELTKYNKVIGIMEQCSVGNDLWVKAEDVEWHIAYLQNCLKTSTALLKIEADEVTKRDARIAELRKAFDIQNDRAQYWCRKYEKECAAHAETQVAHAKTLHKLNTARLLANLWAAVTVIVSTWFLAERMGIL